MSRTGLLVSACAMALVFGCGDNRSDEDAGGIVLMDSGPRPDSGGGGGVDSGPVTGSCAVSSFMPLPAGCLPRCANSTIGVINACYDDTTTTDEQKATCANNALDADPTPTTTIMLGTMSSALGCSDCYYWQLQTCFGDSCPTEFNAYLMCDPDTADCTSQETALDTCITANMTAINTCANSRVGGCFSTTAGFLPTQVQAPAIAIDPARIDALAARLRLHFPL